mgnify:FL=1
MSFGCTMYFVRYVMHYRLSNSAPDTRARPVTTHPKMAQSFPVPTKKRKNIKHNTNRKLNTITDSFINF